MPTANRSPLFVYGTLRDRDVLTLVLGAVPHPARMLAAEAPNHRTVYYPGRSYPALQKKPGETTPGLLLTALTETDFAALDAFEGSEYVRAAIEVTVNGETVNAEVYWPVAMISADAEAWSLPSWVDRHKAAFMATEAAGIDAPRQTLAAIDRDKR